jgi:hypothetical protein
MASSPLRRRAWIIGTLVMLVMIVRVDIWWWGEPMPPVLFGVFNLPMLYQFALWVVGWALVIYTANTPVVDAE